MKRRAMKQGLSPRQEEFLEELDAVRTALYARAGNCCELCGSTWDLQVHHRRRRNIRKDGKANSLANLLLVCGRHHEEIHSNRSQSVESGLIVSPNGDPELVPVAIAKEKC